MSNLHPNLDGIVFRVATPTDAAAMIECREQDPASPVGHPKLAYFTGEHHPQKALGPRIGFAGFDGETIVGYIAGHLTTRFGLDGEIQYLFVAPAYRRRGIATALVRLLGDWFVAQGAAKICVNADLGSPPAEPFYQAMGGVPLAPDQRYWYVWQDAAVLRDA